MNCTLGGKQEGGRGTVHGKEGDSGKPIPARTWRLWIAPTGHRRDVEGLELAAGVF